MIKITSIRKEPEFADRAIEYLCEKWAKHGSEKVFEDCIKNCIGARNPFPQWYLLMDQKNIIGCGGLITNDFISRMDFYPWFCSLFIEEDYRGKSLGKLLIEQAKVDAKLSGYSSLYLCTDLDGYYEKYGFKYIGTGYHPWGESSKIYEIAL